MPDNVILVGGKKFMWDGVDYTDGDKALEAMKRYKTEGFDVEVLEQGGKTCLYTRRVVQQGGAPNA
jgi:hypothetical protein